MPGPWATVRLGCFKMDVTLALASSWSRPQLAVLHGPSSWLLKRRSVGQSDPRSSASVAKEVRCSPSSFMMLHEALLLLDWLQLSSHSFVQVFDVLKAAQASQSGIGPGNNTMAQKRGPQNGHGGSCDSAKLGSALAAVVMVATSSPAVAARAASARFRQGLHFDDANSDHRVAFDHILMRFLKMHFVLLLGTFFQVAKGTWRRPAASQLTGPADRS
eukprot:Skav224257  [mRNA]  locus=scaffold2636:90687:91337:+ [translate_table: standard]